VVDLVGDFVLSLSLSKQYLILTSYSNYINANIHTALDEVDVDTSNSSMAVNCNNASSTL
jgi:hypothetical protein